MKRVGMLLLIALVGACSMSEKAEPLFNGENFDGWHVYGAGNDFDGWYIEEGVLVLDPTRRTKARNTNLVTDQDYTDFELSLDWMISEKGNSGIFWGVLEDTSRFEHPYQTGPEIQILDDNYNEYIQQRGDINRAGSLYGLMPPSEIVSKPANEWNSLVLHIDQTNNEGFVKLNGTKILAFELQGESWGRMLKGSSFEGWEGFGKYKTGKISIQDHGSQVAFRNIRIRELNQ